MIQWKKICYFNDNIATLDVVVLEKKEADLLFKNALNKKGVIYEVSVD